MTNKEKEFWEQWQPTARTCLCFILRGEEILLIRKKRGIGAGKINGPGGHIEPGESALESAIREVQEELGVTPCNLKERGELSFQFIDEVTGKDQQMNDGVSGALHCVVFTAEGCIGEPQETEEAIPYWTHHENIPYHEMWEDDREWLPGMLTRIFHTNLLRKLGRPMNAALGSGFGLDSMYTYSPASKSSPASPHQPSQLSRHDQYEISELPRILNAPSAAACSKSMTTVLDEKFFNGYYFFDQDKLLSGHVLWK
ncbi:MAG TPA: 8-oxo-dGTP diphosphatase [Chthoniobacterales bacterium]|nr:8-oxo-dGTP diphosphatase [Chthoniobacterales bacterium]